MTTVAAQITSLTVVYSTVYSYANHRKHQSSASLAFVWGIHRDRWIPRTKGQLRGKCFHLMMSSWVHFRVRRRKNFCLSRQNRLSRTLDIWHKEYMSVQKYSGWPFGDLNPAVASISKDFGEVLLETFFGNFSLKISEVFFQGQTLFWPYLRNG